MEESLRLLTEQPEWEGDKTLSIQTRCALISEQMNDLFIQQSMRGENQISPFFIRALDGQLQDIWRTLPGITNASRNGKFLGRRTGTAGSIVFDAVLPVLTATVSV
jgi:hypothetical protein